MTRHSTVTLMLASLLAGCTGQAGGDPGGSWPDAAGPVAPCTDPSSCCTPADMECLTDPDSQSICKCYNLWDCSKEPQKCDQDTPTPQGGSNWSCTWTPQSYSCTGTSSSNPAGGGVWSCKQTSADQWTCTRPVPNPTNTPQGTNDWSCTVDKELGKVECTKKGPKPDAGVPKPDLTPAPPPPKQETNCADGIDNDGDGLVDCADSDCPPCAPGEEVCDGKDNNGDGRIDEGGVCNGVAEPCPPNAVQACDCYCGVHRICRADGTWGPCLVDGNSSCNVAQVTSQSQCGPYGYCDYGECQPMDFFLDNECVHHSDCPKGQICDLGDCQDDPYYPCP